jgi:hypothetical protein
MWTKQILMGYFIVLQRIVVFPYSQNKNVWFCATISRALTRENHLTTSGIFWKTWEKCPLDSYLRWTEISGNLLPDEGLYGLKPTSFFYIIYQYFNRNSHFLWSFPKIFPQWTFDYCSHISASFFSFWWSNCKVFCQRKVIVFAGVVLFIFMLKPFWTSHILFPMFGLPWAHVDYFYCS